MVAEFDLQVLLASVRARPRRPSRSRSLSSHCPAWRDRSMVRTLSAATALATLCFIGAPAVAKKCPKACTAELRDDFRRCDDDCPERKAGKECRKICRVEFHKTKTA